MLQESAQTPKKRALLAPMIVLALLGAATAILTLKLARYAASSTNLYHRTENGWQALPSLPHLPERIRVSPGGRIWALTVSGLCRWDDPAWRCYQREDFGSKTSLMTGGPALDGEDVWAPGAEGVVHWDGERWSLYPDPAAAPSASIVAGGGQVWVAGSSGTVLHFEKGLWTRANWAHPESGTPELARTSDGAVWLFWRGLWRSDGTAWAPVTAGADRLTGARFIGAAGDRLWLTDPSGLLRSLSMDGKSWTEYAPTQTGLSNRTTIRDLAWAGSRTWFATSDGLIEFDGSLWRRVSLPSAAGAGPRSVAAGPGGDLWVMGMFSPGASRAFAYLTLLTILLPVAFVGVIIWTVRRLRRRRLQQHQRVTEAVQHATGDVPEELQQGARRSRGALAIAAELIAAIVGFVILRQFWPQAPLWIIPVLGIAIYLVIVFQQSLVKRKPKPSDPIGPGAPSLYDWGKAWKAVAGALFIVVLVNADRLPALKFLRGYTLWLLILVPFAYRSLMVHLMNQAARRADYGRALEIIRGFHFYNPSGTEALRMSGHMLLAAGRYREAEDVLRRSLASSQATRESHGSSLEFLGDALLEQGRYDEAARSYEAALHAFPWVHRPYRGLAELRLREGKNPQQALEYAEKIVDFTGLSWTQRQANGKPQDDYWALKAWALASLGRSSEVPQALENALKATDKSTLPDLAATHYRAGMAMQALGNQTAASEHFKQAVQLDPQGRRGALANAMLQQSSVWGRVRV